MLQAVLPTAADVWADLAPSHEWGRWVGQTLWVHICGVPLRSGSYMPNAQGSQASFAFHENLSYLFLIHLKNSCVIENSSL